MTDPLVGGLRAIVGARHVLTESDVTATYTTDWTGRFVGAARAVVRPADTAQVAAVLRSCAGHRVSVVPQGGNTGLVGGATPSAGEMVLSLRRLDELGPVDTTAMQVTAGAGVTLGAVQAVATAAGFDFGIDMSSRDSATIGGMVATNAGGTHVLRYGDMRAQVMGVEAVLADGTVVQHLGGLVKDNTGYHLPSLLTGSEGTLAVVTRARLRLWPRPERRTVAVLGLDSVADAVALVAHVRRTAPSLLAAEMMTATGVDLVERELGVRSPLVRHHAVVVLLEAAGQHPDDDLASALSTLDVAEVAVASDHAGRERLWAVRDRHTEAIALAGVAHKLDVAVPLPRMAELCTEVVDAVAAVAPAATVVLFGHLGDGNVHVNIVGVDDAAGVDGVVLRLVAGLGGSISAEHGIGVAKRAYLGLARTPAELEVFRAVRDAFDPEGVLNPRVLLPRPPSPASS